MGGDEILQRRFHLALLGLQRRDVAFELLALIDRVLQRALEHRDLVLDVDLPRDAGAGERLVALGHGDLDLPGQLLILRIELVEAGAGEVLDRLDPAELGAYLVGRLVDLADRLRHRGLGSRVLNRVEKCVNTSADHAGHASSNRISHVFSSLVLRTCVTIPAISSTLDTYLSITAGL